MNPFGFGKELCPTVGHLDDSVIKAPSKNGRTSVMRCVVVGVLGPLFGVPHSSVLLLLLLIRVILVIESTLPKQIIYAAEPEDRWRDE
jgi:hypothetical protein